MSADTPLHQDRQPEMLNISDEEDLNPGISYIQLDEEGREVSDPMEDKKIAQMTDEELRREYKKLPPSLKQKYNQCKQFHSQLQKEANTDALLHAYMQRSVTTMQPAIPDEIAHEEMQNYEMMPDQVQIIKMVDKDGKEVKRVCPILIKKEIDKERGCQVPLAPSDLPTGMPLLGPHKNNC